MPVHFKSIFKRASNAEFSGYRGILGSIQGSAESTGPNAMVVAES